MARNSRTARWGLALLSLWMAVAGLWPLAAHAQSGAHERLIYKFNFEERGEGNFEDLPMHWFPIGRTKQVDNPNFARLPLHKELMSKTGFPVYTEVRFDDTHHTSGKTSFYLGLNGGSAGAFLETGTIPIVPKSDYLITANVMTTPLQYARARLVAYFIDDEGRRVDESVATSELVRSENRWTSVSIKLQGDFEKAAWIGMEIQLLQPQTQSSSPLGKRQLVYQEVRGGAWFDDIAVWQLPRVMVGTQSPVNIIRAPERPRLNMEVRDLTGRALVAELTVYDYKMHPIAVTKQPVGDGAPEGWRWSPTLPGYGWYYADLVVRDPSSPGKSRVARSMGAFLWLEEGAKLNSADTSRFALESEDVIDEELARLPAMFDAAGIDSAIVSCWSRDTGLQELESRQAKLDQFLQTMMAHGRDVTLSLTPVPQMLKRAIDIDRDSPIGMFQKTETTWMPYLAPILLRDGQRVHQWQIGSTRQPDAFFMPELPTVLSVAQHEFQSLAPQPQLVVPWRLDQARRRDVPSGTAYAIDVPARIRPSTLSEHLQEWKGLSEGGLRINLRSPPATELDHERRIADLTERMLYAWEALPTTLSLDHPWTFARDHSLTLLPDPLLGVFTSVAHRLAGRRVVGHLHLGDGIECMILDGPAGGMLAAWNRSASNQAGEIDMFLGASPVSSDVFGNKTTLSLSEGRHHFSLGRTPVFITGIDPALALFRASFHLSDPFIESKQTSHARSIVISNPWPRTISGYMLVTEPQAWQIEPRRSFFSIAAGQSTTIPLHLSFPVSEVAGEKNLVARFDFNADQHYVVDVTGVMELGLKDVDFDANVTIDRGGDAVASSKMGGDSTAKISGGHGHDVVVTQQITNSSNTPMALYAFANMPGFPRQERLIPRLKPGQSIIRRFRFPNADDTDAVIHVGLRETSGPAVLNKVVSVQGN